VNGPALLAPPPAPALTGGPRHAKLQRDNRDENHIPDVRDMPRLRRLVLERLMRYYRFLAEGRGRNPPANVTSAEIADALDVDPTQVRKDLGAIGLVGLGRVGFDACEVCRAIRVSLGFDRPYRAVLVGAGHLGSALMAYARFSQWGLQFAAAFDTDRRKIGHHVAGCRVQSVRSLAPYVERHGIRMAILTTPVDVAQRMTDRLVAAGVRAIWNFTPTRLTVPADVFVRNEHISLGLSELAYYLLHHVPAARQEPRPAAVPPRRRKATATVGV
jgi:redox-sensing transcriptional repressor